MTKILPGELERCYALYISAITYWFGNSFTFRIHKWNDTRIKNNISEYLTMDINKLRKLNGDIAICVYVYRISKKSKKARFDDMVKRIISIK